MTPVRLAPLVALALALAVPSFAQSGRWSVGLGGDYVTGYTHAVTPRSSFVFGSNPPETAALPGTWAGNLSVRRRVSDVVTLAAETSYLPFDGDFETIDWVGYSGSSDPPPTGSLRARFVTLGIGPRFTRSHPGWRTRVFLDLAPVVIWSEHESSTGRFATGGGMVHERRSARAWLGGVLVGGGFGGPIRPRLGYEVRVRYLRSSDPDSRAVHDVYYSRNLRGLSTFLVGLGLTLSP